jgi:hypothetical protein
VKELIIQRPGSDDTSVPDRITRVTTADGMRWRITEFADGVTHLWLHAGDSSICLRIEESDLSKWLDGVTAPAAVQ